MPENTQGKISDPHKCEKTLITLDSRKLPKEGVLIDYANRQFALVDCYRVALFPNGKDRIRVTKKELAGEVRALIKGGFSEAELSWYKDAQLESEWISEKEAQNMEKKHANTKGKVRSLSECQEVLRTKNQFNFSEEALAIDHKNSQFAVFNGMARSKGIDENSKWTTHKEVRERLRFLIKQGYTEADMGHGQADYRLYLPEYKKELAAEIKARARSAERGLDTEKTLAKAKKKNIEAKEIKKEREAESGLER